MSIIVIVGLFLILLFVVYLWVKHLKSSSAGQCIYVTSSGTTYNCNCSRGMSQKDCTNNNGLYDAAGICDSSFVAICQNQLLGSCTTSVSCFFPSTKDVCTSSSGSWTPGNTCPSKT